MKLLFLLLLFSICYIRFKKKKLRIWYWERKRLLHSGSSSRSFVLFSGRRWCKKRKKFVFLLVSLSPSASSYFLFFFSCCCCCREMERPFILPPSPPTCYYCPPTPTGSSLYLFLKNLSSSRHKKGGSYNNNTKILPSSSWVIRGAPACWYAPTRPADAFFIFIFILFSAPCGPSGAIVAAVAAAAVCPPPPPTNLIGRWLVVATGSSWTLPFSRTRTAALVASNRLITATYINAFNWH